MATEFAFREPSSVEHEAVVQARQRLEGVRSVQGEHHPEYATALNHLALLLIMHGAPDEAEPLLHQALAIRKETLGEDHPEYATCLSSLGGLLWARGDMNAAEPRLRKAHEIRSRVLGPNHTRTLASLSCLEQFLRMKEESGQQVPAPETMAPAPASAPVTATPAADQGVAMPPFSTFEASPYQDVGPGAAAPGHAAAWETEDQGERAAQYEPEPGIEPLSQPVWSDARSQTMSHSSNDLSHELVVLTDVFSDLGERLMQAARQLQSPGLVPPDSLIEELASCRRDFSLLRDRTLDLAQSLQLACPPPEELASLEDLTTLLDEIAETEIRLSKSEEVRRRSLLLLDRVLTLAHTSDAHFSPLHDCQHQARALHQQISEGIWHELPAEAASLAEGEHGLSQLMSLIEDADELSDETFADLYDSVSATLGRSIAVAAIRKRLHLPLEHAMAGSEQE